MDYYKCIILTLILIRRTLSQTDVSSWIITNGLYWTMFMLVRRTLSQTDSNQLSTEDYSPTTGSETILKEHSDYKTIFLGTTLGAIGFVLVAILLLTKFGRCNTKEDLPSKDENVVELKEILFPDKFDDRTAAV